MPSFRGSEKSRTIDWDRFELFPKQDRSHSRPLRLLRISVSEFQPRVKALRDYRPQEGSGVAAFVNLSLLITIWHFERS